MSPAAQPHRTASQAGSLTVAGGPSKTHQCTTPGPHRGQGQRLGVAAQRLVRPPPDPSAHGGLALTPRAHARAPGRGRARGGGRRQKRVYYLGEEVDAVGDGAHGDGVAADEEAAEVHPVQAVQLGVEAGELPDVIADHVQQALGHVLLGECWGDMETGWRCWVEAACAAVGRWGVSQKGQYLGQRWPTSRSCWR